MLTTTEAPLLGLMRSRPMSGYDLRKDVERSVGYFWAPAKTQMYSTLPKLASSTPKLSCAGPTRPPRRSRAGQPPDEEADDAPLVLLWALVERPGVRTVGQLPLRGKRHPRSGPTRG